MQDSTAPLYYPELIAHKGHTLTIETDNDDQTAAIFCLHCEENIYTIGEDEE